MATMETQPLGLPWAADSACVPEAWTVDTNTPTRASWITEHSKSPATADPATQVRFSHSSQTHALEKGSTGLSFSPPMPHTSEGRVVSFSSALYGGLASSNDHENASLIELLRIPIHGQKCIPGFCRHPVRSM